MYWPDGMKVQPIVEWPGALTKARTYSNFSSTLGSTMTLLRRELAQLNAKDVLLQIAIPREAFRLDGFPRATAKPEHPGIILTMTSTFGPLSYPCDTYVSWQENLRAIALALEALRKVDRYGVTKRGEQYRGFLALEARAMPAAGISNAQEAHRVLFDAAQMIVEDGVTYESEALVRIVRKAKFKTHPDTLSEGGDPALYERVVAAEAFLVGEGWL